MSRKSTVVGDKCDTQEVHKYGNKSHKHTVKTYRKVAAVISVNLATVSCII